MNMRRESDLIRALKIQLTTVNGYARMLEREVAREEDDHPRQRDYMNRLVQSLGQLQRTVQSYEQGRTPSQDPGNSSPGSRIDSKGPGTATR